MVLAIFVFAPIGLPAWYWLLASRILGIPLIAGLSYEVIKWAGKNRNKRWVRALMWPGLMLQNLTTREPDQEQLAVAIRSLEEVLEVEDPSWRRRNRRSRSSPSGGCRPPSDAEPRCTESPRQLRMIDELVEQIESRHAELERADVGSRR